MTKPDYEALFKAYHRTLQDAEDGYAAAQRAGAAKDAAQSQAAKASLQKKIDSLEDAADQFQKGAERLMQPDGIPGFWLNE